MGTPVKTRIKDYRARLRAKGYRGVMIYLTAAGYERLVRLSQHKGGVAYGDLIGLALEQYESQQPAPGHHRGSVRDSQG